MITAPSSGSGKTTVTLGLIRALKNKGLNVCGFKTGPDYIDTTFIKSASKKNSGNLDMHLQGREGLKKALAMGDGECFVIEGAMGYFDGIYNTYDNSSFDISRYLGVNAVLVYTPKGEMFSAVPKIKGMAEFEGSMIKAVILNKVNEQYYNLLKEQIVKYTNLKVLGFVPPSEDLEIKSRHLGLMQSIEIDDVESKIEKAADFISEYVDLDLLMDMMTDVETVPLKYPDKRDIKVAVAQDKAFSFYYNENLELLEKCCTLEYFSPLEDSRVPPCDLVYLGGGYPEIFKKELSENKSMLSSIKDFAEHGGCIYGECGGFMYLMDYIEEWGMAGVFRGKSCLTKSLQRFGYIDIELKKDCMLGCIGDTLTAHEFHKSVTEIHEDTVYKISKTMGDKTWSCGFSYKNVLAGYPHISFLGNMKAFNHILDYMEEHRKEVRVCT